MGACFFSSAQFETSCTLVLCFIFLYFFITQEKKRERSSWVEFYDNSPEVLSLGGTGETLAPLVGAAKQPVINTYFEVYMLPLIRM